MTKRRASNEKLDEILRRPYTIEIEYGGRTYAEASAKIIAELRAYARPAPPAK